MANDDRALVVGISHYPGIRDLKGPSNDVDSFMTWLTDPNKGNVPPENVRQFVSDPTQPNRPILTDIEDFFNQLVQEQKTKGNGTRIGRRVYLFLSGHGFAISTLSQAALCMADANAAISYFPHLGGQIYADDLGNRGMFDEVVLWMDCCRQMINGMTINPPPRLPALPPRPPRSFFWGFATTTGELAAEAEFNVGGVVRPHGIFTALLLEGLDACKSRAGGEVYTSDVANYIYSRMVDVLGQTAPRPRFQGDPAQDILLFTRKSPEKKFPITIVIADGAAGTLRFTTGQHVDVFPGLMAYEQGRCVVELPAGVYQVTKVETGGSALFEVPGSPIVNL